MTKRIDEARSRGRPSLKEAQRITNDILRSAREEFLVAGYEEATFERIAQLAGTTRTAIYSRFADKPTLFAEVFAFVAEEVCSTPLDLDPHAFPLAEGLAHLGISLLDRAVDPRWLRLYEIGWGPCRNHPKMMITTVSIWKHYLRTIRGFFAATPLITSYKQNDLRQLEELFASLLFSDIHVSVIYGTSLPVGQARLTKVHLAVELFLSLISSRKKTKSTSPRRAV